MGSSPSRLRIIPHLGFRSRRRSEKNSKAEAMRSSQIHSSSNSFRFLDLPGELRNIVYEMALPKEYVIGPSRPPGQEILDFGLLYASRQLREESRCVLYRSRIHVELSEPNSHMAFFKWIHNVGYEYVSRMKALSIYAWIENLPDDPRTRFTIRLPEYRFDIGFDVKSSRYTTTVYSRGHYSDQFVPFVTTQGLRRYNGKALTFESVEKVLEDLSRESRGRFCVADIKSIVGAVLALNTWVTTLSYPEGLTPIPLSMPSSAYKAFTDWSDGVLDIQVPDTLGNMSYVPVELCVGGGRIRRSWALEMN